MSEKRSMTIKAIATLTIEFELHSAWDGQTSLEQTYDDARRSAVSKINNCVRPNGSANQLPEGTKLLNVKISQVVAER